MARIVSCALLLFIAPLSHLLAQECSGPPITISAPSAVCRYAPARAVVVGVPDAATIKWTRTGVASAATSDDGRTLYFTAGTFSVALTATATTASGCSSASVEVAVLQTPEPPVVVLPDEPWCALTSRTATLLMPPAAGESIEWSIVNGTITAGANSPTASFTTAATGPTYLYASATSAAGCAVTGSGVYSPHRRVTGDGQPIDPDAVSLTATRTTFSKNGGSAIANLSTGCNWTAQASAPWVSLTGTSSGSGSASVPFTLSPNTSSHSRSATLTIGGLELSLVQEGSGVPDNTSHSVETIIGSTFPDFANGPAHNARFAFPAGIAVNTAGEVFVADRDNRVIRRVAGDGSVTTFAGAVGVAGYLDGPASDARFAMPGALAIDSLGNLFVADGAGVGTRSTATVIRKITPSGIVSTLAGRNGLAGFADGSGTAALFDGISALSFGPDGNLYVADQYNYVLRRVTPAGDVSTIAGLPNAPWGHDGPIETAMPGQINGVAVAPDGVIYLATADRRIRKIESGNLTTIAGGQFLYLQDGTGVYAGFGSPASMVFSNGELYLCDGGHVRKVTVTGTVTTLAGLGSDPADGPGSGVDFQVALRGIAAAPDGGILFTEETIRRIDPNSLAVTTVAGLRAPRDLDPVNGQVLRVADDALLVAQSERIRKVAADGTVTPFAGQAGVRTKTDGPIGSATFTELRGISQCPDTAIYVVDFGSIRRIADGAVSTIAGNKPASHGGHDGTGSQASFANPADIVCHPSGDLYVADGRALRRVTPAGVVTTVAGSLWERGYIDGAGSDARFFAIANLALGTDGSLYVADRLSATAEVIRRVEMNGTVATFAGRPGVPGAADGARAIARFSAIRGMTATGDGLFVTDGNTLRHVDASGTVRTIAGLHGQSGVLDATGSDVRLRVPHSIVAGDDTDLFLMDDWTVRRAAPSVASQLPAPAKMRAVRSGSYQVNLTWPAVENAAGYEVFRSYGGGPFTRLAVTTSPSWSDTSVIPKTAYLYRVRAFDASGSSPNSATDLATTFAFTDDPIVALQTFAKAAHLQELREAIDAARAATNLPPLRTTAASEGVRIMSQHIVSLRSALNAARVAAGLSALAYTNGATAGTVIRAADVNELRAGTQ